MAKTVSKGPVMASRETGTALDQAKANRPISTERNRPKTEASPRDTVRFETTGGIRNLTVKLAFLPYGTDDTDEGLTTAALNSLGERRIQFTEGRYTTSNKAVIAWLRGRIKSGRARSFQEYVPQPTARQVGSEQVVVNEQGDRLMTYDEFLEKQREMSEVGKKDGLAAQNRIAAVDLELAPTTIDSLTLPNPPPSVIPVDTAVAIATAAEPPDPFLDDEEEASDQDEPTTVDCNDSSSDRSRPEPKTKGAAAAERERRASAPSGGSN